MFSRLFRPGKRSLESLSEQEILALAISSEEDDGRIYLAYADALREAYPHSARIFEDMAEEESHHRQMLIDPDLPLVRDQQNSGASCPECVRSTMRGEEPTMGFEPMTSFLPRMRSAG